MVAESLQSKKSTLTCEWMNLSAFKMSKEEHQAHLKKIVNALIRSLQSAAGIQHSIAPLPIDFETVASLVTIPVP